MIRNWSVWATIGTSRRCLDLTLNNKALKAAIQLLRHKGYRSIYPVKG